MADKYEHAKLDVQARNEKFGHKIESETSMGVISAFLGGFALSMISEFDQAAMSPILGSLQLLTLAMVCALTLGSVLLDGAVYFSSKRMLAGRMHESPEDAESLCAAQEAAKKRLLRHTQRGSQPYRPRAAHARAAVPPCPGAARPSSAR